MKTPNLVLQLIDELRESIRDTNVVTVTGSNAKVYVGDDMFQLSASQCELVFHSTHTVQQFHEALNEARGIRIELDKLSVDEDVEAFLETLFDIEEV